MLSRKKCWHFPWWALLMNVLSIFLVWWPSEVFIGGYTIYKPGYLYFHCQALIMMWTYTLHRLAGLSRWSSATRAAVPGLMERTQDLVSVILNCINSICALFVILRLLFHVLFNFLSSSTRGPDRVAGRSEEIWFTSSPPCMPTLALPISGRGVQALASLGTQCHCSICVLRSFWYCNAISVLRKEISDTEFICFGQDPSRFGCDCISTLLMVPLALSKWVKAHL